jgi:hypothetical protein
VITKQIKIEVRKKKKREGNTNQVVKNLMDCARAKATMAEKRG